MAMQESATEDFGWGSAGAERCNDPRVDSARKWRYRPPPAEGDQQRRAILHIHG